MMVNPHLLALPDVVQDHILSMLTIPEQLGVRLVCKTTKSWVDRSRFRIAEHIPASIVRDHGRNSFARFLSRRIPHLISSAYLENDTLDVFESSPYLTEFLERFSESITSLRLKRYFICSGNERQVKFLEDLANVESLEIDEVWIANADDITTRTPETFRQLTSLKLGRIRMYDEPMYSVVNNIQGIPMERKKNLRWYVWTVLDICEQLKHLRVPASPKLIFDNTFDECFRLLNYLRIRTRGVTEASLRGQYAVLQCDLTNFTCCTSSLEVLLIVGSRMRIQFLNVNSKVFKRGSSFCVIGIPPRARFDYIHSMVSSSLVNRNFDYIQKLTFKGSLIQNECIIGREKGPTLFPNLKEFHIILDTGFDPRFPNAVYSRTVTSQGTGQPRNVCFPRADQVLKFFFAQGMPYNFVHTVSIEFCDPVFPNQKRATPEKLQTMPIIIGCLPRLKNLTIKGWNCKRQTYFDLWHGFPGLKRLVIDSCSTMNPTCFIGGNCSPNNPANFRFLPDLEYIELRGLENMPEVNNRTGNKYQMTDVFAKLGFVPFDYLSKLESQPTQAAWFRPDTSGSGWPRVSHSTIVTRSVSTSMQL